MLLDYILISTTVSLRRKTFGCFHYLSLLFYFSHLTHLHVFLADKKAACFSLGGFLLRRTFDTLLQCDIECCTDDNCNNQTFNFSPPNAVTVFTPEGNKTLSYPSTKPSLPYFEISALFLTTHGFVSS